MADNVGVTNCIQSIGRVRLGPGPVRCEKLPLQASIRALRCMDLEICQDQLLQSARDLRHYSEANAGGKATKV